MRTRLCIQPVAQSSRMPASTNGIAGPAALPGVERRRILAPGEAREGRAQRRLGQRREMMQQMSREFAPAELAQIGLARRRLPSPRAASVARTACQSWRGDSSPKCRCGDRREVPSRSGRSRSVAIAGKRFVEKRVEPPPRRPPRPAPRHRQARPRAIRRPSRACFGSSAQSSSVSPRGVALGATSVGGAGAGRGGSAPREAGAPERREHLERLAVLGDDILGLEQQRRIERAAPRARRASGGRARSRSAAAA